MDEHRYIAIIGLFPSTWRSARSTAIDRVAGNEFALPLALNGSSEPSLMPSHEDTSSVFEFG
jgi:hypothetical protein